MVEVCVGRKSCKNTVKSTKCMLSFPSSKAVQWTRLESLPPHLMFNPPGLTWPLLDMETTFSPAWFSFWHWPVLTSEAILGFEPCLLRVFEGLKKQKKKTVTQLLELKAVRSKFYLVQKTQYRECSCAFSPQLPLLKVQQHNLDCNGKIRRGSS